MANSVPCMLVRTWVILRRAQMAAPSLTELADELGATDVLARPLCVSLDGTLVRTGIMWERLLLLVRKRPWLLFSLPFWLVAGRARIERRVREQHRFDAAALPYRKDLVELLRGSREQGRRIVLLGGSDAAAAGQVANHLGFFEEVLPVDTTTREQAEVTRKTIEERFGAAGFDFVGDSAAQLPLLAAARRGYLVGATPSAAAAARTLGDKTRVISTRASRLKAALKVMRPHQWSKNALVVVPLMLAPGRPSLAQLVAALVAFVAFSLCASAGYVFNDLIDVEADRAHKTKHRRPFASGDLPVLFGPPLFLALFLVSFAVAWAALPLGFVGMLAIYFVATLAYSLVLKSKLMVDVVVLAWLYTHRVLAGGIATGITISAWLLGFSMFTFASLAFAKRYIELQSMNKSGQIKSRGYHTRDQEMVASMGPSAGYIAVLLFCLYVESHAVSTTYRHPELLWFIAPVLFYWISRVWFLAHRGHMQDDPVKFALTDRRSWVCAIAAGTVAAAARFWY
jgi:4-hydroxybenzoate polyprenyltransferase/phosphoserine phosphatase